QGFPKKGTMRSVRKCCEATGKARERAASRVVGAGGGKTTFGIGFTYHQFVHTYIDSLPQLAAALLLASHEPLVFSSTGCTRPDRVANPVPHYDGWAENFDALHVQQPRTDSYAVICAIAAPTAADP